MNKLWVAIGFYANLIVIILAWLCSTITIFASKSLLDMVLNSVAVLFMIQIDDEIVTFSDYDNVLHTMAEFASKSRAEAGCDKIAEFLLKIQVLWAKPRVCALVIFPLTLVPPLFTLFCYGPSLYDENCDSNTDSN